MPYPRIAAEPDFARLETILRRGTPDRVPFVELIIDQPVLVAIREAPFSEDPAQRWNQLAEAWRRLGYDYLPVGLEAPLPRRDLYARDTAVLSQGDRMWINENTGVIESWEDFERYPWPRPEGLDYSALEHAAKALPEGMRLIAQGPGGVLENVMWLMGYAPMSYAMADDPTLVEAMFARVGELLLHAFRNAAAHEAVGALWLGDDMGFKTQPMISPEALRRYVFPWQRRIAEIAHAAGKPFLLHACGNLETVMDDLIDYVKIDGKHSFEDVIMTVPEAKRRWGNRVAVLGGVDMDLLSRGTPDKVRARTREVLEECMPGGGFGLGSGNTVANYVPLENYFALLEEGWRRGAYA